MSVVSIVINLDTRPGFLDGKIVKDGKIMDGPRSIDFLTHGVMNKIKFFEGYEQEVTVYVDVHDPIPQETINELVAMQTRGEIHNLCLNKHTENLGGTYYPKWNDLNFLNAMAMARGNLICHFDGDMSAFRANKDVIDEWIGWIDEGKYDFVSYPSVWSPGPVVKTDWEYWWASTRFHLCRREFIDYTEILKCLSDSEYLYGKYGDKKHRCPWYEHVVGMMAGPGRVFYPPADHNKALVFAWQSYQSGLLDRLNKMSYPEVVAWVMSRGGISYPCDVRGA